MGFFNRKPKSEHVTSQQLRWREEFEAIRKANDMRLDMKQGKNFTHHMAMILMAQKKKAPGMTFEEYKDQLKAIFRRENPKAPDYIFEAIFKVVQKELEYMGHKDDFVDHKDASMVKTSDLALYKSRFHSVYTKNGKKYVKHQGSFILI